MKMTKNQKPTDISLSLKYICPNKKCRYDHWISLRESKIKNFKIVCDCGHIFCPKPIQKICIKYKKEINQVLEAKNKTVTEHIIPQDLLEKSSRIMQTFGFRAKEAKELLSQFYKTNPINDYKQLVQSTLAINGG